MLVGMAAGYCGSRDFAWFAIISLHWLVTWADASLMVSSDVSCGCTGTGSRVVTCHGGNYSALTLPAATTAIGPQPTLNFTWRAPRVTG